MSSSCRPDVVAAVEEICGLEPAVLVDDADLETLGIDSLDLIEIGMLIEEKYEIEVDSEAFADAATFGQAVAVFDRIIGAK